MSGEISATCSFLQTPSGSRYFNNLRLNHKLLNGFERPISRQPLVFFLSSSDSALKLFCLYKSTYKKISSRQRSFQAFEGQKRLFIDYQIQWGRMPDLSVKEGHSKINLIKLNKLEGYFSQARNG